MEIYTDNEAIILKKYSHVESINNFIAQYAESVFASSKREIIITDNERIIAVAGNFRKDIVGKKIDIRLDDRIQKRNTQVFDRGENLEVADNLVINAPAVLKPIAVYGDLIGAVIVVSENAIGELEKSIAEMTSLFIGKYLES